MARSRNIKPGFAKNEVLAELSPHTRLLFIGLWWLADRDGRLEDRPKRIKAEVFPYEDLDVDAMLGDLAESGFVVRYTLNGNDFIQVVNWSKHQNPHKNEVASQIPPPQDVEALPTKSVQAPEQYQSNRADSLLLIPDSLCPDSLEEPNGSCTEPDEPAAVPEGEPPVLEFTCQKHGQTWPLSPQKLAEWEESYPAVDVLGELRKARQWLVDNPTKRKTPRGMTAFLGRWLARAVDRGTAQPREGPGDRKPRLPTDEEFANWNPLTG